MTQLGLRLKERGLDAVEHTNLKWVDMMRNQAKYLSLALGAVDADDIRDYAKKTGLQPEHPNAYGAVFRGKGWKAIGWVQSRHASNHGRSIRVWKWQP